MAHMSKFTKINFEDVESSAGQADVDARFARRHLDSRELGVSYFRYSPGFRYPSGHRHREQEEVYVVVGGSGRINLDGEVLQLRQWDVVRVAPEVLRAVEAGPEGLEIIAVGTARPEGGDGEQAPLEWGEP